ncbi:hypothetical protein ACWGH4_00145 [Streptomyces sp. NPDC054847]
MTRTTVLLTAAAAAAVLGAATRLRYLHRAVARERTVARLAEGIHQRDLNTLKTRIRTECRQQQILAEADRILTAAIAAHHPQKGG